MDPKKSRDLRLGGDAAATPLLGPGRGKIWGVIAVIWVQNGVLWLERGSPLLLCLPWRWGSVGWGGNGVVWDILGTMRGHRGQEGDTRAISGPPQICLKATLETSRGHQGLLEDVSGPP